MSADYLEPVDDLADLTPGCVLRRVGGEKEQQGGFRAIGQDGGLVVVEVVDLAGPAFAAEAGVIRPAPGDQLFALRDSFGSSDRAQAALEIIRNWPLYRDLPALQSPILHFVRTSYTPAHVLELKREDQLARLFVPIQQRFKIGKFREKIDWDAVGAAKFKEHLDSLADGQHITYVAFIPKEQSGPARFYSIGTKPHLETLTNLKREPFAFVPNHGGHIKIISAMEETPRRFIVDAGSNDLGSGTHTSLATAEMVTECLEDVYPGAVYEPKAGRGAHGIHQSY